MTRYNISMGPHADVLILGGGVIGLTTAYYLARDGAKVAVVDKGDFGQEASWAGAGILPPGNSQLARSPFDRLRAYSVELYPALSKELAERTRIDNGYLPCGGLELLGPTDEAAEEEWRGEGIPFTMLDEHALHELEPALAAGLGGACHLPTLAQVRNPRHLKALVAGCRAAGVTLHAGRPIHGFERRGERIVTALSVAGDLHADRYLLATGAWTEPLLEALGWRSGIRPVRGQIALLNTGVPLFRRVIMHGSRYLVPRPDSRVLVGSTEENVGYDKRTTAEAIHDLLELATKLVPALGQAGVERTWAGLRPGSPDGLPVLGPVPGLVNLFVAAGHFRAGLQLAPGTGSVMKDLLLGRKPTVPIDAFRLDRAPAFRS